MGGKQMEGDNRERRKMAKEARDADKKPSEIGASLGASKQRTEADANMTHQERIDLKKEGKVPSVRQNKPTTGTRTRDNDSPDRERHPRL
jgi:hypothetical protein